MRRALLLAAAALAPLCAGQNHAARLLAVSSSGPAAPTAPVAGYDAWFDAGQNVYSDAACSVAQTTDAGSVACWTPRAGAYGSIQAKVPGGYGPPSLELNEINGRPVIRSEAATFELLADAAVTATIFEGGILQQSEGTAFSVVRLGTIDATNRASWGDNGGYLAHLLVDGAGVAGAAGFLNDGTLKIARKAVSTGAAHVLTWHHQGGTLYSGVDDTRATSMASVAAGSTDVAAGYLVLLGNSGPGAYLNGDLAEVIFYKTALTEANRQLVERYLAAKYAIALPY